MKKLYLFTMLLAFALNSYSQCDYKGGRVRDEYFGVGVPTITPATTNAIAIDYANRIIYRYKTSTTKWVVETAECYYKIYFPDLSTPPPGSTPDLPFIVATPFGSATTFAAAGWNQAAIDLAYPGIGATTSDMIDWAELQYRINLACSLRMELICYRDYYVNRTLRIPPGAQYLKWSTSFAIIWTTNSSTFDVISKVQPSNLGEMQIQLNSEYDFENLIISCQANQTGFKPGPSTSSRFTKVTVVGGLNGFVIEATMCARLELCVAKENINGFILRNDDCVGCDADNSNTNMTMLFSCRAYGPTNGAIGFGFYSISGGKMYDCITEGFAYTRPVVIDGQNANTIKSFYIFNFHYECATDMTDPLGAVIDCRLVGGNLSVNGIIGHYKGLMIKAKGTVGNLNVVVQNVDGWAPSTSGDWFYNDGSANFMFFNVGNLGHNTTVITNIIGGVATNYCANPTAGCGSNYWSWIAQSY